MKKTILVAAIALFGFAASAQSDSTRAPKAPNRGANRSAQAQQNQAAKTAEAQPEQELFVLVGTAQEFEFLRSLLLKTVLPLNTEQSVNLINWIGSRRSLSTATNPKK